MSELGEKCRLYIEKSGTNIYRIAKQADLDRTMLQKVLKGTRLPGIDFFRTFIDALSLNKTEVDELWHLYMVEKIGRDVYERRELVHDLITRFHSDWELLRREDYGYDFGENTTFDESLSPIHSSYGVADALSHVISYEYDHYEEVAFYMDFFEEITYAQRLLYLLDGKYHKKASCTQFLHFARFEKKREKITNTNLRVLKKLLPFIFAYSQDYDIYYSYIKRDNTDIQYQLWPHYFITHEHVLLISGDEQRGLLVHDEMMAAAYRRELSQQKLMYNSLMTYRHDMASAFRTYQQIISKHQMQFCYETAPCVDVMLRDIDLSSVVPEANRDFYQMYAAFEQERMISHPDVLRLYELRGLERFLAQGELPGNYKKLIPKIPEMYRQSLINNYLYQVKKLPVYYQVREAHASKTVGLSIRLCDPHTVIITSLSDDLPFGMMVLEENSLFDAFYDYFDSLLESGVYDPEESALHIEKVMMNHG